VRGCSWRGPCPDHDELISEVDAALNALMRSRPFGAGRKRHRQPARYDAQYVVKSEVVVTSIAERHGRPQPPKRRTRIIHPNPIVYPHSRTSYSNSPSRPKRDEIHTLADPSLDPTAISLPQPAGAVEPAPPAPHDPVTHKGHRNSSGSNTGNPTPSTLAALICAKSATSDPTFQAAPVYKSTLGHIAGSSDHAASIPTFPRRRGRRVEKVSDTPAIRYKRRRQSGNGEA